MLLVAYHLTRVLKRNRWPNKKYQWMMICLTRSMWMHYIRCKIAHPHWNIMHHHLNKQNQIRSVVTYPSTGGRGKIKRGVFQKGKCAGVATNVYSRKTLEKPKRGLQIFKIRVHELFTHREGISTPRARPKGRQPLIECAKNVTLILFGFPFYIFIFLGSTRVLPLLLHTLRCNEEFRPT